jgi:hypothetical protein
VATLRDDDDDDGRRLHMPSMTTGGRKGGRLLPLGQPRYDERFLGIQSVCLMPMKLARGASMRAEVRPEHKRPEHNHVPRTTSSSLACRFEHGRFKRLAGARASPGYKLERRVVLLTCVEGSRQEHLALATRRLGATGKHERMTKQD